MEWNEPIEALVNKQTKKFFILLDDSKFPKMKVIIPSGEVKDLPEAIFNEDPELIEPSEVPAKFTSEQLDGLIAYRVQQDELAKQIEAEKARKQELLQQKISSPRPVKKTRSAPQDYGRSVIAARWETPRLTFYKHRIEPLRGKQSFEITIDGHGVYEISKDDFQKDFNDVIMNSQYRTEGIFTYAEIPDKMMKYKK